MRRKDLGIEALLPVWLLPFVNASLISSLVQPDQKMHSEKHPRICTVVLHKNGHYNQFSPFGLVLITHHVYLSSICYFFGTSGKGECVFCLLNMT